MSAGHQAQTESVAARRDRLGGWRALRPHLGATRAELVGLVLLSGFAGFAEAGVLLLVVQSALAVTGGNDRVDLDAGPLSVDGVAVAALLGAAALLLVAVFVARIRTAHLIAGISTQALDRSRRSLFRAFASASWDVQSREKAGLLQDVMTTNLDRVAAASLTIATGLAAAFQFAALLVSGVAVQPAVALLILVSVVALYYAFRPISRMSRRSARGLVAAKKVYVAGIAESVAMAQEVRTFDVGDAVVAARDADSAVMLGLYRRARFLGKVLPSLYQNSVLAVILLGVVAIHVLSIDDVAALGAVVLMLVRALTYSQTVQTTHQSMADLMPYLHSMAEDLARYEEAAVSRDGEALDRIESIHLADVTFTYTGSTRPALADVDLEIRAGEAIGIVGPSGSGKSTFMQVLLRLRQPQGGALLVNGRPAEDLAVGDWFRQVALVPQEARLTSASVRDNVRFHRPHLSDADLQRAVEQAHVADDIARFEDGWDTHVGERGGGAVSGGQRQRICIARALAGRPDVLVLDEPTSALDMRSESLIRETLEELKGTVTLVIIAHRMSTLSVCDRLVVFDGGRISAVGPADELLRTDPFLAEATALSGR